MMLPLVFLHASTSKAGSGTSLADFWHLFFHGLAYVLRLVNTHAVLGLLTAYGILDMLLKHLMLWWMGKSRGIESLFERTFFATSIFGVSWIITMSIVTLTFQVVYNTMRDRLEEPKQSSKWIFDSPSIHWLMTALSFIIAGPVFFLGLAYSVWSAAIQMVTSRHFCYEVAAKPKKEQRATDIERRKDHTFSQDRVDGGASLAAECGSSTPSTDLSRSS
jgi:hypothetical protein